MKVFWKTPVNPNDDCETITIEGWVNDFNIGYITVKFTNISGWKYASIKAVSSTYKTTKQYVKYDQQKTNEAAANDYEIPKQWVEDQWNSMLVKSGLIRT